MARRKPTISVFDVSAFQDIITSTTGIMLVITLLLALIISLNRLSVVEQDKTFSERNSAMEHELQTRKTLMANISQLEETLAGHLQTEVNALQQAKQPKTPVVAPNEALRTLILPQSEPLADRFVIRTTDSAFEFRDSSGELTKIPFSTDHLNMRAQLDSALKRSGKTKILIIVPPSTFPHYLLLSAVLLNEQGPAIAPYTLELIPEEWEVNL